MNVQHLKKFYKQIFEKIEEVYCLARAILNYIGIYETPLGVKMNDIIRNFIRLGFSKAEINLGILNLLVYELIAEVQEGRYT